MYLIFIDPNLIIEMDIQQSDKIDHAQSNRMRYKDPQSDRMSVIGEGIVIIIQFETKLVA